MLTDLCFPLFQRVFGGGAKKDSAQLEFTELLMYLHTVFLQDLTELMHFYPEDHLLRQVQVIRFILDHPDFVSFSAEVQAAVERPLPEVPVNMKMVRAQLFNLFDVFLQNVHGTLLHAYIVHRTLRTCHDFSDGVGPRSS